MYTGNKIQDLPWQKHRSTKNSFHQQIGFRFKGKNTSKVLHLERSFVWC
jgi:hypothetical protein